MVCEGRFRGKFQVSSRMPREGGGQAVFLIYGLATNLPKDLNAFRGVARGQVLYVPTLFGLCFVLDPMLLLSKRYYPRAVRASW